MLVGGLDDLIRSNLLNIKDFYNGRFEGKEKFVYVPETIFSIYYKINQQGFE